MSNNRTNSALVAGLGITGFAMGFALRDIIPNLLAGALVMIYQPFRRNDEWRSQTKAIPIFADRQHNSIPSRSDKTSAYKL